MILLVCRTSLRRLRCLRVTIRPHSGYWTWIHLHKSQAFGTANIQEDGLMGSLVEGWDGPCPIGDAPRQVLTWMQGNRHGWPENDDEGM